MVRSSVYSVFGWMLIVVIGIRIGLKKIERTVCNKAVRTTVRVISNQCCVATTVPVAVLAVRSTDSSSSTVRYELITSIQSMSVAGAGFLGSWASDW